MAPTSSMLQGLNVVYAPPQPSDRTDAQDLLEAPPFAGDLAAQLDLWTNVSFASDEPFVPNDRASLDGFDKRNASDPSSPSDSLLLSSSPKPSTIDLHNPSSLSSGNGNFDLEHFLAGLGVDPFQVPPNFSGLFSSSPAASTSLETTLAGVNPPSLTAFPSTTTPETKQKRGGAASTAKKGRARKDSTPSVPASTPAPEDDMDQDPDADDASVDKANTSTPLTAAEDKRRRNTAASARFRLKKKEREQAMDKRAKDLENKVSQLERECEALRRENGWLKGIVTGVTGGNPTSLPPMPGTVTIAAGTKRSREDEGSSEAPAGKKPLVA